MNLVIVEDNGAVALCMRMALERHQCRVQGIAGHPAPALGLCHPGIDLVLTNLGLAYGRSGVALARFLRQAFGIPSLYLTGHPDQAHTARDTTVGCLGWPFTDLALTMAVDAVHRVLSKRPPDPVPYGLDLYPDPRRAGAPDSGIPVRRVTEALPRHGRHGHALRCRSAG